MLRAYPHPINSLIWRARISSCSMPRYRPRNISKSNTSPFIVEILSLVRFSLELWTHLTLLNILWHYFQWLASEWNTSFDKCQMPLDPDRAISLVSFESNHEGFNESDDVIAVRSSRREDLARLRFVRRKIYVDRYIDHFEGDRWLLITTWTTTLFVSFQVFEWVRALLSWIALVATTWFLSPSVSLSLSFSRSLTSCSRMPGTMLYPLLGLA